MKRIILLTVAAFIATTSIAAAHPPQDMEASYDMENQVLLVKMSHVVRNPTDHRIARMIITKNGEEREIKYFPTQTSAKGFEEAIPLEAGPGDELTIKAICNKAGSQTITLSIENE